MPPDFTSFLNFVRTHLNLLMSPSPLQLKVLRVMFGFTLPLLGPGLASMFSLSRSIGIVLFLTDDDLSVMLLIINSKHNCYLLIVKTKILLTNSLQKLPKSGEI
jgi:hypothetical protein